MFMKFIRWSRRHIQAILFTLTSIALLMWLWPRQSMANISGDAADIWKTIVTYYSGEIYPSYVLYKGFMAVYPYVWFYQLALVFDTNEFLFVMIYHAILFSYIATVGVPKIICYFFKHNIKLWQRLLLVYILFIAWRPTQALDQIMVDLPSCAIFILAINCAIKTDVEKKAEKFIYIGLTGLLCSLGTAISGQYSVAMTCVMLYVLTKQKPLKSLKDNTKRLEFGHCIFSFFIFYMLPILGRVMFDRSVLLPMRTAGVSIAGADFWLKRGLIYMMNNNRLFSGVRLACPRGFAILTNIYGSPEAAFEMWELAGQGGYGWTIADWFKVFADYPVDILCMMLDKAFITISVDLQCNSLIMLIASYSMLYIAIFQLVTAKRNDQVFSANAWLVLGIIVTIAPLLVLSVEMRCAISLQAMIFGSAILGPTLPKIGDSIKDGIQCCICERSLLVLKGKSFPWAVVFGVLFVAYCVVHMGGIYAQADLGVGMLFKKF